MQAGWGRQTAREEGAGAAAGSCLSQCVGLWAKLRMHPCFETCLRRVLLGCREGGSGACGSGGWRRRPWRSLMPRTLHVLLCVLSDPGQRHAVRLGCRKSNLKRRVARTTLPGPLAPAVLSRLSLNLCDSLSLCNYARSLHGPAPSWVACLLLVCSSPSSRQQAPGHPCLQQGLR